MKILYLLDIPINSIGGSQKSTKTIIEIMYKNGHDVWLMCPQNEKNPIKQNKVIFFYKKKKKIVSTVQKIMNILLVIRKYDFDIINAQNPESAMIIGFLKKMNLIPKRNKTVFTDRGFLDAYTKEEINRFKNTISGIDYLICTTHINQNAWKQEHPEIKSYTINNIVEEIWFSKTTNQNLSNKGIVVGFCGRFDEYKRWDTVEKIIKEFSEEKQYSFIITLTSDNKIQTQKMKKFIDRINKYRNVKIYLNLSTQEMIDFYDSLDIFVLTSEGESFGRTLIEAMMRKTIVIGTDSGGVPEVIEEPNNLFRVDDVQGCINIIKRYDCSNIEKEKNKFYEYARKKYSIENFETVLLNIYECILRGDK